MLDICIPLVALGALVLIAVLGGRFIATADAVSRVGSRPEHSIGWLPGHRDRALLEAVSLDLEDRAPRG